MEEKKEMTVIEAKAMVYDLLSQEEMLRSRIAQLNQFITKKTNEQKIVTK